MYHGKRHRVRATAKNDGPEAFKKTLADLDRRVAAFIDRRMPDVARQKVSAEKRLLAPQFVTLSLRISFAESGPAANSGPEWIGICQNAVLLLFFLHSSSLAGGSK